VCHGGDAPALQIKAGNKLDQKIKSNAEDKRTDSLRPNLFLVDNSLRLREKNGGSDQPDQSMTRTTDPRT